MLVYCNIDSISPSIEALNELNLSYKILDNGNVFINLDRSKYTIISNNSDEDSLSYLVIDSYNYRIIASGNLAINNREQYNCNGVFRVYSKYLLTTYEYYGHDTYNVSYSKFYDERLIRETNKKVKSK